MTGKLVALSVALAAVVVAACASHYGGSVARCLARSRARDAGSAMTPTSLYGPKARATPPRDHQERNSPPKG